MPHFASARPVACSFLCVFIPSAARGAFAHFFLPDGPRQGEFRFSSNNAGNTSNDKPSPHANAAARSLPAQSL